MWKETFAYVLNSLRTFKAVHKKNPWTHSPQQNKKTVDDSWLFLSLYSRKIVGTIITLRIPSFTKKDVFGLKQKK